MQPKFLLPTFALGIILGAPFSPVSAQTKPAPKSPPVPPALPDTAYQLEDALDGIVFSQPLGIVSAPGEKDRLFVIEKTGVIKSVTGLDTGKPVATPFLDLTKPRDGELVTEGECGVLGLAFHPAYADNGRFFVYYSLKIDSKLHQRLAEFRRNKDKPETADPTSELPLYSQLDPASNHNGGDLLFGPDGYLYNTVGDGGAGNDLHDQARFINKGFHAAVLRLDVDKKPGNLAPNPHPGIALNDKGEAHYAIPADNPFINARTHHGVKIDPATVRTEIWATGFRNPWRMSFDPVSKRIFVGDVGQNLYEEIDIVIRGGDYGWSYREGLHPFTNGPGKGKQPLAYRPIDPIYEYPRTTGLSVTGGHVYHGSALPELQKAYIFADYAFGRVIALRESKPQWQSEIIVPSEPGIAGIGVNLQDKELLFANMATGKIRRLTRR